MRNRIAFICAIMIILICNSSILAVNEDIVPPKVIFASLNNNSSNIELNRIFSVSFNEPIFIGGIFSKISMEDDKKKPVKIIKSLYNNKLIVKVETNLSPNTKYTLTIPAKAITDKSGNSLQKSYSLKFKTSGGSLYIPKVKVSIFQDGREYIASRQNEEIQLNKKKFSFRFLMPVDGSMCVAALDNENSLGIVKENISVNHVAYFSGGTGIASNGPYETLFINNEAHHDIYLSSKLEESRAKVLYESDNNQVDVLWEVSSIGVKNVDQYDFTKYFIENTPLHKLYLVFFIDYNKDGIIGSGEYLKTIISFADNDKDNTKTEGVSVYKGATTASNDEYIFYTDKYLYRSTIDKIYVTKMNDVVTSDVCLIGDSLYYCCEPVNGLPFRNCISRMTIYGASQEIITGGMNIKEFMIIKDRIYFLDDEAQSASSPDIHLYSVNMDGTNKTLLQKELVFSANQILSSNGMYLYYSKTDNHKYCCRLDGTNEVNLE